MPVMSLSMRTVCHTCRATESVRIDDGDGVPHLRRVPAAGDGEVMSFVATASGFTAALTTPCPDCKGTGWIAGFTPPC